MSGKEREVERRRGEEKEDGRRERKGEEIEKEGEER